MIKIEVLLVNKSDKSKQSISISKIDNVYNFLNDISINLNKLENDSYYFIIFKYKNKYNREVSVKLGYIYMDEMENKKIVTTCDENYLNYYIEYLKLNELTIEYKMNIGNINKVKVEYNYPITKATEEINPKGFSFINPEKIISKDFNIFKYDFYNLKEIKYINLDGIESTLEVENIIKPMSELAKDYSMDISKNISFYWETISN